MSAKILIAGRPGSGKTTVIRQVLARAAGVAGGFLTEEIRHDGRRVGFRVEDVHDGTAGVLSHVDRPGRPRVGKYGVDVDAFDRVGVAALRKALARPGLIVIDEIGKMELCSKAFREVVTEVMDSERCVLATIPVYRLSFVDALRRRPEVSTLKLTAANRDELPERLLALLAEAG